MNEIEWTRQHHKSLADNGVWGVPRSGLIFQKTADGFKLMNVMPYTPEMSDGFTQGKDVPASPSELRAYQFTDFELLKMKHEEAGLEISDPKGLLLQ